MGVLCKSKVQGKCIELQRIRMYDFFVDSPIASDQVQINCDCEFLLLKLMLHFHFVFSSKWVLPRVKKGLLNVACMAEKAVHPHLAVIVYALL